jgi:hypothetical protein
LSEVIALAPVVKRVRIRLAPAAAFDLFTRELARWWPLATHSCHGAEAVDVLVEPRVGGAVTEVARDGRRAAWGRVIAWDPPRHFAMTWHPGAPPEQATRLEVSFHPAADGAELELVHAGWEARGEAAAQWRGRYDGGWVAVLEHFSAAARQLHSA